MYTIIDIIDKIIEIEKKALGFYKMLQKNPNINERVRLAAGVFAREEGRHIEIYEGIKKDVSDFRDIQIDFDVYDSISKIVLEFRRSLVHSQADDVQKLLSGALDFEQKNLALVIRIQGLLVRKKEDAETNSYKALTRIIHEEEGHIKMIETFLR